MNIDKLDGIRDSATPIKRYLVAVQFAPCSQLLIDVDFIIGAMALPFAERLLP